MKMFLETIVLVLFVSSFAIGYTNKAAWNETVGMLLFAAGMITAILTVVLPSKKAA